MIGSWWGDPFPRKAYLAGRLFSPPYFWKSLFRDRISAPRRVWKKLLNKKKVVIVVDGEGVLGKGQWEGR